MYKAIIIDDNRLEMDTIKSMLEKNCPQIEVVNSFRECKSAIDYLIYNCVDIVFTDIQMPKMSGLDMIEFLYEQKISAEVIFITCYDDSRYLRRAMELGADAYVLKPVMEDELIKAVSKTVEKCEKRRETQNIKEYVDINITGLRQAFIYNLLTGKNKEKRYIYNSEKILNIKISNCVLCVVLMDSVNENAADDLINSFYQSQDIRIYSASLPGKVTAFLFASENSILTDYIKEKLINISRKYNPRINFGISNAENEENQFNKLFEQSRFSLLVAQNSKIEYVVTYKEVVAVELGKSDNIAKEATYKKVEEILISGREDMLENFLNKVIFKKYQDDITGAMSVAYMIFNNLFLVLEQYSLSFEKIINVDVLFEELRRYDSVADLKKWVQEVMVAAMQQISHSLSQDNVLVRHVCSIIHEKYADKVTLDNIAKDVGTSKRQLHRVFMKNMGMSVLDYLTNYRMEQAKKMLEKPGSKVYAVATSVGYKSRDYFSEVFTEVVGMTPVEFKLTKSEP